MFRRFLVSLGLGRIHAELHIGSALIIGAAFHPSEPIKALIGRDLLERCLFVYDGRYQTFTLAF